MLPEPSTATPDARGRTGPPPTVPSRVEKTILPSWESIFVANACPVFKTGETSGKSCELVQPTMIRLPCRSVAAAKGVSTAEPPKSKAESGLPAASVLTM